MAKRVVLAYSGGLDTSVAVAWLRIELGYEVIAVAVDVGQDVDFDALRKRATAAGAVEVVVVDAREELLRDFAMPTLAANALYEGRYPLVSALSRPVIVRHLVAAARQHGATAVAHGCTGKGNDQVRFEVGTRALAPDLEIVAPVRVWGMTREETIDYADKHDIAVTVSKDRIYSIDANLWGRAIECGVLEDPWAGAARRRLRADRARRDRADRGDRRLRARRPGHASTGAELGLVELVGELGQLAGLGRLRSHRHRRGPPRRHQEPRGLRVPGRARADHGARGPRRSHP